MAKSGITPTEYSIKDLEHFTGIKAHTIRIWESRYSLISPRRSSTNIRSYSGEDLKKLLNIAQLVNHGYRISKLAGLSDSELNELVRKSFVITDFEALIDRLIADMIRFDQASFESKLNEAVEKLGFEEAVFKVFFPLFSKIGVLWQTNATNPAQEHFVSNIIRMKFLSEINALTQGKTDPKSFLLFLPENEQHEMGLLFASFLIRKYGHTNIYLGQNVPLDAVVKTWEVAQPDYLFTHLTTHVEPTELSRYLKELSERTAGAHILLSGQNLSQDKNLVIRNVKILASPADFIRKFLAPGNKLNGK